MLVYQDWRTEWFPPMAQAMLEQFHHQHPDIRVFYVPDPVNLEDALVADMQNGTAPDVFAGCCSFFPVLAQAGYALDLRELVTSELDAATIGEWDPAQYLSLFSPDGRQYGLPKYHGALALYYNKDLLDQYSVDYPEYSWDHDDYLAAMRLLTHGPHLNSTAHARGEEGLSDLWGSMVDVSWDRIQVYINAWGGHFVDPNDRTRCAMGDPQALEALEWLRMRMWDDKVMATALDVQNLTTREAFIRQKVAMVEDGSWALKDILANAEFRVGVAPLPAGPARRVTLTTTDGFGIYSGTHNPEAAWKLLKFLISKDYGLAMARASFLQPARASLLDQWIAAVREQYPDEAGGLDLMAFAEGQLNGYSVTAEVFPNMADARRYAEAAWQEILTLGQAPASRILDACAQIQAAQPSERQDGTDA